jgi:hypothetical protein
VRAGIETERRATADMGMPGPTLKTGARHFATDRPCTKNLIGSVFSSNAGVWLQAPDLLMKASQPGNDRLFQRDRSCELQHEPSAGDG